MILTDLQRPFDTLNHKILLEKMRGICFSDKTIKWFNSYLINSLFQSIEECIFGSSDHKTTEFLKHLYQDLFQK